MKAISQTVQNKRQMLCLPIQGINPLARWQSVWLDRRGFNIFETLGLRLRGDWNLTFQTLAAPEGPAFSTLALPKCFTLSVLNCSMGIWQLKTARRGAGRQTFNVLWQYKGLYKRPSFCNFAVTVMGIAIDRYGEGPVYALKLKRFNH